VIYFWDLWPLHQLIDAIYFIICHCWPKKLVFLPIGAIAMINEDKNSNVSARLRFPTNSGYEGVPGIRHADELGCIASVRGPSSDRHGHDGL
jgi:hypothetical protein